ncbi:Ig-like domain-containing protein [Paenibacillus sp. NAIST15-1]|uniref:Ig-like domain-containing protein n=1 Tax=Paenibacillus sp. NAIST15-1 TaxID=1605994 RepID=UPI00086BBE51|nr:Ig-like domain-containing protein [Paenibacillus sp. NAIST15-1]GAV11290.1 conserved domain protein [Paenibacillus sp. NAIST15-1]
MGVINDYKTRISSANIKSSMMTNTHRFLRSNFHNSPSYFEVSVNSSPTLIRVTIVDDSKVKEQKEIVAFDYELKNGDIVDWLNEKWITILTDNMGDGLYYRSVMRRCVGQLKWIDNEGAIQSAYFTFKSDPATNFGVEDGRIISIGNERRSLIVDRNSTTAKFKKGNRFIFDGRAWKISALDTISVSDISIVTVDEDEINTADDNLELGIANYISRLKKYSINVLNQTDSLKIGETYQVIAHLYDGDKLISGAALSFTSSNETVATVDQNGLVTPISEGETEIIVAYGDIRQSFVMNVKLNVIDSLTVVFETQSLIYVKQTKTFTVHFENNGQTYDDSATFKLLGDDDTPTTLATIQSTDINECVLVAGSKIGHVKLHISNSNNTISSVQRIQIKSII